MSVSHHLQQNRGRYLVLFLVLVAVLALVVISQYPTPKDEVRVAVLLPETGEYSFIGRPVREGLELGVEGAEKPDDRYRVKLEFLDTGGETTRGLDAVARYYSGPNRACALVTVLTGMTNAVRGEAEARKIPLFGFTIHPTITQGSSYVFRIYYSAAREADELQRIIAHKQELRWALLVSTDPQTQAGADSLVRRCRAAENVEFVFRESYGVGSEDYRSLVSRLKTANPEAIMVPGGYAKDVRLLLQELQAQGLTEVKLAGGIALLDIATKYPREAVDGMVFLGPPAVISEHPTGAAAELQREYKKRYGKPLVHEVAYAYDTGRVLVESIRRSSSLDGADLAGAIRRTKDFDGASGTFSIDADNDAAMPLTLLQYKGGQIIGYEVPNLTNEEEKDD